MGVSSRSRAVPGLVRQVHFLALNSKQKPPKPMYLLGSRGAGLQLAPGEFLRVIRLLMQVAQVT